MAELWCLDADIDAALRAQLEAASLEAAGLQSELLAASGGGDQAEAVTGIQKELLEGVTSLEAVDSALNELASNQGPDEIANAMAANKIGEKIRTRGRKNRLSSSQNVTKCIE